ncbi:hypothetical protein EJ08DRAFT_686290 [Tothia fuscella]|uniref:Uncharacterized protein n=1 Tax=Tothia fuscella TaxID=1048955 RepID=A0A9P4NWD2_9PEZI|nr:hypothetical protein EJ08DRAFT_686290 [Tothia fuscella]
MSFSYDRYDSRRRGPTPKGRSLFGHYIPLIITVSLATAGVAAWVWSAREDHDSTTSASDDEDLSYGEEARNQREHDRDNRRPPSYGVSEGVIREGEEYRGEGGAAEGGLVADVGRGVREVMRRTPSPQQAFDSVKKYGAAGVAAAGAVVGGALSSIREEGNGRSPSRPSPKRGEEGFSDHERWSEEAEKRVDVTAQSEASRGAVSSNVEAFGAAGREGPSSTSKAAPGGRRKTVAVVVSGETMLEHLRDEDEGKYHSEQASLLSHLPRINTATTNLLILIYNPASQKADPARAPSSIGSSYAAINTPAQTPGDELSNMDPMPYTPSAKSPAVSARSSGGDFYDLLHKQAVKLVEDPVNVMPFSTPTGWVHMLKHLSPDVVYVVESLTGSNGEHVKAVKGWVGQLLIVAGADGSGLGGLIDTEDEGEGSALDESRKPGRKWWQDSAMVGLGKGVEVVDGARLNEDWERRVSGRD